MTQLPEFLTASEVADIFGVSRATVSTWAKRGKVPSMRTPGGRERRFPKSEIYALAAVPEFTPGPASEQVPA